MNFIFGIYQVLVSFCLLIHQLPKNGAFTMPASINNLFKVLILRVNINLFC